MLVMCNMIYYRRMIISRSYGFAKTNTLSGPHDFRGIIFPLLERTITFFSPYRNCAPLPDVSLTSITELHFCAKRETEERGHESIIQSIQCLPRIQCLAFS